MNAKQMQSGKKQQQDGLHDWLAEDWFFGYVQILSLLPKHKNTI